MYTTYGNIYTKFGLGVRQTGHLDRRTRPGFSAGVLRLLPSDKWSHSVSMCPIC
jgi:hypothetical protein